MGINDLERMKIYEHAEQEYPGECCGVLLGDKETLVVSEIISLENADEDSIRNNHYSIDPLDIYKAECDAKDKGIEILGFYHSHADHPAIPSGEDERYMIPGLLYMIVSVMRGNCVDMRVYSKESDQDIYLYSGLCPHKPL